MAVERDGVEAFVLDQAVDGLVGQVTAGHYEGIAEVPVLFNRKLLATSVALLMAAAIAGMDKAVQSWRVSICYLWQNRARR